MGNWSCFYHWHEFQRVEDACNAYQKLESAVFDFGEWKNEKIGLKFGWISPTLLQVVTSQKWGLSLNFFHYIHENNGRSCAMGAGIDSDELFLICGTPVSFTLNWNYFFCANQKIDITSLANFSELQDLSPDIVFERKCFSSPQFRSFLLPFYDETNIHLDATLSAIVRCFANIYEPQRCIFTEDDSKFILIFGRNDPIHGRINFGELVFFADHTLSYDTTGAYNPLSETKILGNYVAPILDEPKLKLNP